MCLCLHASRNLKRRCFLLEGRWWLCKSLINVLSSTERWHAHLCHLALSCGIPASWSSPPPRNHGTNTLFYQQNMLSRYHPQLFLFRILCSFLSDPGHVNKNLLLLIFLISHFNICIIAALKIHRHVIKLLGDIMKSYKRARCTELRFDVDAAKDPVLLGGGC